MEAARLKKAMRSLRMSAVGHTPQGFGFGRALDSELMSVFGVELEAIEARELIDTAKGYTDEECAEYLKESEAATCGLDRTPAHNRLDHARLLKAYSEYVRSHGIGALASRCWPDFFTAFGTPVCTVLSMLNDEGVAAACEADIYGALSMWIGMRLTGEPVFFGDPVSLDEAENTITFWHEIAQDALEQRRAHLGQILFFFIGQKAAGAESSAWSRHGDHILCLCLSPPRQAPEG